MSLVTMYLKLQGFSLFLKLHAYINEQTNCNGNRHIPEFCKLRAAEQPTGNANASHCNNVSVRNFEITCFQRIFFPQFDQCKTNNAVDHHPGNGADGGCINKTVGDGNNKCDAGEQHQGEGRCFIFWVDE